MTLNFRLTLLSLLFLISCSSETPPITSNDTLVENVNGYSMTENGLSSFNALLIREGKVLAIGNKNDLDLNSVKQTIDGAGKTVLPGLIDAHGHVLGLGKLRMEVDLVGSQSIEEALQRISTFAAANPDLPWVKGQGWNQVFWPGKTFPTAKDLDSLEIGKPIWMERVDGHAGWANSEAFEIAGITASTVSPSGGEIYQDEDGKPSGVLVDKAMALVEKHLPEMTPASIEGALKLALKETSSLGLTSVHDAGIAASLVPVLKDLAQSNQMPTRIYAMLGGESEFDKMSTPLPSFADDKLSVRSVKLYSDGALGSRGAAMLAPYNDQEDSRGLLFESQENMNRMVRKMHQAGFQVNVHAIGDHGNRQVLDAFAELGAKENQTLRHRIEHAQVIDIDDLKRFNELNIIASMQPTHATSDMNMAEDRVGKQRIAGAYAWRTLLDMNAKIASGSDFPVESANPFWGLHAAVTRQSQANLPAGGWYPGQAMTREEALYSFTLGAAYAAHQETTLGSLEPGKWADFIVIDQDYFSMPASDIWKTKVLQTWVAGEKVYQANN